MADFGLKAMKNVPVLNIVATDAFKEVSQIGLTTVKSAYDLLNNSHKLTPYEQEFISFVDTDAAKFAALPKSEQNDLYKFSLEISEEDREIGLDILRAKSRYEARKKEQTLLNFFEQPFGAESKPWIAALMHNEWLKQTKPEFSMPGSKTEKAYRKDKVTQNRLHEYNPALRLKSYLDAGLLPKYITYEVNDNGKYQHIDPDFQSMEHAFSILLGHDQFEDYPDWYRETYLEYMNDNLSSYGLSHEDEEQYRRSFSYTASGIEALTMSEKRWDNKEENQTKVIPTHNGSGIQYILAIEKHPHAVIVKPKDRIEGITTRYRKHLLIDDLSVKGFYDVRKDRDYLEEASMWFQLPQTLEHSMARFPEFAPALDLINTKLEVVFLRLKAMTLFHPNMKHYKNDDKIHPEDGLCDLSHLLVKAYKGVEFMAEDVRQLHEDIFRYRIEATRYKDMDNLVLQMEQQSKKAMDIVTKPQNGSQIKIDFPNF